jgi:hydrogenase/urease accessory protein HupE
MKSRDRLAFAFFLAALFWVHGAIADVFRPTYLELTEAGDDVYTVLWKVPATGDGRRLSAYVAFPEGTEEVGERRVVDSGDAWIERWSVRHAEGLAGKTVRIEGNAVGVTDVIARYVSVGGSSQVERLSITHPQFVVPRPLAEGGHVGQVAWSYTLLGVEHILGGIDHLLFVLALLLIVKSIRRLVWTITAFTLAHSITLAAATLGWVSVPGPPVEAAIALSIVFVASEVVHGLQGRPGITARAPWVVAFSFGLLHGLGFAGALSEVGLPQNAIPTALLMFNVGVELGQLMFIAAILVVRAAYARLIGKGGQRFTRASAYGIGSVAAFWTIERIAAF